MRKRKYFVLLAVLLTFAWAAPLSAQQPKPKASPTTTTPTTAPIDEVGPPAPAEPVAAAPVKEAPAVKAEEEQEWWELGLVNLIKLAFLVLGIMATVLVRVLMKKYGFEAQSAQVNDLLTKAIGFAEQKALKASKLEEGKKTSSAEKMEMALTFAKGLARDYKLPNKADDWWEDKLESWLGVQQQSTKPAPKSTEG